MSSGNSPHASYSDVASSVPFDNSTNGFVSTDVQSAIEEARSSAVAGEAVSVTAPTTTSSTDALLTSMTFTLPAGTYLFMFNSSMTINSAGNAISASYYLAGVQIASSLRKIAPFDGGTLSAGSGRGIMQLQDIITVNGSQAIEVRWSTSGGTATCGERSFVYLKVG